MARTPDPDTVFIKPDAPRSDWELFKWMFFEPTLLRRYSRTLSRKESILPVLRMYFKCVLPLALILYALWIAFLVVIDLPGIDPEFYHFISKTWPSKTEFIKKWIFLSVKFANNLSLGYGLALSLVVIFTIGLRGLFVSIAGAVSGLLMWSNGYIWGFASDIDMFRCYFATIAGTGISAWLLGLAFEIDRDLTKVFISCLVLSLFLAFIVSFQLALNDLSKYIKIGLGVGLGSLIGLISGHLRLVFYPIKCLSFFKKNTFTRNPYLHDEGIWLPLPWVKHALRREAANNPDLAFRFIDFLLRYRPLQMGLAAELEHVATAGRWQAALRLRSSLFDNLRFLKDEELPEKWAKYTPSLAWRNKLGELRDSLLNAEIQTAVVLKKDYYEQCPALLREIERLLLHETFQGRDAYFPVLVHWKKALENQMQEVNQDVARVQVVSVNPYVKGNALSPGGVPELLDRQDAKDELTLKIQTSVSMPTFLILGQRRVGKTSLLNFLPVLLDQGSFAVATIDAQSMSGELSVPRWLRAWRARAAAALGIEGDNWEPPDDWLEAWDAFAEFLRQATQGGKRRLILAMDEYDEEFGFHHALRQDPARAGAFLSRMRAFSQSEKRVVFLFVGATQFSDLPEPKWSKYFVHIHIVRVDYLSETSSLQLIERPSVNFKMKYKEGVSQHIYNLTQGHPHLLHSICSDLVDYANIHNKNPISHGDLRKILSDKTLQKGEQPFTVFWEEFCEKPDMRKTVRTIAKRLPVSPEQPEVRRLLEYGYIVPDAEIGFRMRVPLFEKWVLQYGY